MRCVEDKLVFCCCCFTAQPSLSMWKCLIYTVHYCKYIPFLSLRREVAMLQKSVYSAAMLPLSLMPLLSYTITTSENASRLLCLLCFDAHNSTTVLLVIHANIED